MPQNNYYQTLSGLAVSWINDGLNPSNPYFPAGNADLSYCADTTCTWSWKLDTGPAPGLCYVKCRSCGADAQIIAEGVGSVRLPCKPTQQQAPRTGSSQ